MSPEQIFFVFDFLCYWLYRYGLSKHKFFDREGKQLMKILRFIFSGDQEKKIL